MNKSKAENRGIDEELFLMLCGALEGAPAAQNIGMGLIYAGQGEAGIKARAKPEYTSFSGRLHGGIIAAVADTAMGWAVGTLGNSDQNTVTVDININYFIPVFQENEIIAEGYVIHAGKNLAVAGANLFSKGKLIAKSRGTFFLANKIEEN